MPFLDSKSALIRAVMAELAKEVESPLHGIINLSSSITFLANRIKCCAVQVECKAGCDYLVKAFGDEAELLQKEAMAIQSIIENHTLKGSGELLSMSGDNSLPKSQEIPSSTPKNMQNIK